MQRSTGVGAALRRARVTLGVSVDEAARDTRIRPEILEALEEERFGPFRGATHVRGFIRTYARYLGLPAERLVEQFQRAIPTGDDAPPPMEETVIVKGRDGQRFARTGAAVVLVLAAALGVLSARQGSPDPADLAVPTGAPTPSAATTGLLLAVTAQRDVGITVTADDGEPRRFDLVTGESRSFEADGRIVLALDEGSSVNVVVNGVDLGTPGAAGVPWTYTYLPGDAALSPTPSVDPSASGTPMPSGSVSGSVTVSGPSATPSATPAGTP